MKGIYIVFLRAKEFYYADNVVGGMNSLKSVSWIKRACWEGELTRKHQEILQQGQSAILQVAMNL